MRNFRLIPLISILVVHMIKPESITFLGIATSFNPKS